MVVISIVDIAYINMYVYACYEINSFHNSQIQNMQVKGEKRKVVNNKEATPFWNTEILLPRHAKKVGYW